MFTFMRKTIGFFSSRSSVVNYAGQRHFTTASAKCSPATYSGEVTKDTPQSAGKDHTEKVTPSGESILAGSSASEKLGEKVEEYANGRKEGKGPDEDYTFSPEKQDFMLENVNGNYLKKMCGSVWFGCNPDTPHYGYLETAEVLPKKLPVRGSMLGSNRMWINLVCQAQRASTKDGKWQYGPARNVTFFVALGSPYTYLSRQTIQSLVPDAKTAPDKLDIQFHPAQLGVDRIYMSPETSHFAEANVLGNNIFKRSKMEIFINYRKCSFEIMETAGDESEGGLK